MRRATLFGIISSILFVTALVFRNSYLLAAIIPLVLLIREGEIFRKRNHKLKAQRRLSDKRVPRGAIIQVSVKVENTGEDIEQLLIQDVVPEGLEILEGDSEMITPLPAGEIATLEYRVRCTRGRFIFSHINIHLSDNLGIGEKKFVLECPEEIISLPPTGKLKNLPIQPRKTLVYAGENPARSGGDGVYFFDIREYQSGDPLRHIHWKALARRPDRFYTKEFEQERVGDIGIILDARNRSYNWYADKGLLEYSIEAAGFLSEALLGMKNRVGMLVYGRELNWTVPGYGKRQAERLRVVLAEVTPGDHQVFQELDNLPTRLFPARSQIILISPLIPEDVEFLRRLRGRGYSLIIVSPNPLASDMPQGIHPLAWEVCSRERQSTIISLERVGVPVVDWNPDDRFEVVISRYAGRLREFSRRQQ